VHIFDRDSARIVHTFNAGEPDAEITGIAFGTANASMLMLATATNEGPVRIWASPLLSLALPPPPIQVLGLTAAGPAVARHTHHIRPGHIQMPDASMLAPVDEMPGDEGAAPLWGS